MPTVFVQILFINDTVLNVVHELLVWKLRLNAVIAFLLKNHLLEFCEIWQENTAGNK